MLKTGAFSQHPRALIRAVTVARYMQGYVWVEQEKRWQAAVTKLWGPVFGAFGALTSRVMTARRGRPL